MILKSVILAALATLVLCSSGCMTISAVFNHKSVVGSASGRKSIGDAALAGDALLGLPVGIGVVYGTDRYADEGWETAAQVISLFTVVLALPVLLADFFLAQSVHYVLYGERYDVRFGDFLESLLEGFG